MKQKEAQAFTSAIVTAVDIMPAFRDGLGLLRPYFNSSSPFAQIDEYSRVGLGPLFFKANSKQRASVLLHEVMHVLNNHFSRGEQIPINDPQQLNIAGDLEINHHLNKIPKVDISFGILPEDFSFKGGLTMEQYAYKIADSGEGGTGEGEGDQETEGGEQGGEGSPDGEKYEEEESGAGGGGGVGEQQSDTKGDSSNSGSSGNETGYGEGLSEEDFAKLSESSCNVADEEISNAADEAGIERASDLAKNIAKKSTRVRLEEEARKSLHAGDSHLNDFIGYVLDQLEPSKVPWQRFFSNFVGKSFSNIIQGKSDYSYQRVNRRMTTVSRYIFPGYVSYQPKAMVGIDTSLSMSDDDFLFTLSEVDAIINSFSHGKIDIFTVDTQLAGIELVSNVKDLELKGGGGTDMTAAWEYVLDLPQIEKPDLFALFSDGGFSNWSHIVQLAKKAKREGVTSIVLITDRGGFEKVPKEVFQSLKVLDISIDDSIF